MCGWLGESCTEAAGVTDLPGAQGRVAGSTVGAPSAFGDPSGEAYFSMHVPPNTASLLLDTCMPGTDFDTSLTVVRGCFAGPGSSLAALELVAHNEDASPTLVCARLTIPKPPTGQLYILLEGFLAADGNWEMQYAVTASGGSGSQGGGNGGGGLQAAANAAPSAAMGAAAAVCLLLGLFAAAPVR
jgi:hypothetical protein